MISTSRNRFIDVVDIRHAAADYDDLGSTMLTTTERARARRSLLSEGLERPGFPLVAAAEISRALSRPPAACA
jgi:hypothetical protein